MTTFAIKQHGSDGVSLWCHHLRYNADGSRLFTVLNGGWRGRITKEGDVECITRGREGPTVGGKIVWEGTVPEGFNRWDRYEEAMAWIDAQIAKARPHEPA